GQHAEAGGDMIDEAQDEIRALAGEVGLTLTRILRGGFAYVQLDASGKPRIVSRDVARGWDHLERTLDPAIRPYRLAEQRWDTPIATALAKPLGERLHLRTELVAVSHRGRAVRVTVKNSRSTAQIACDYLVLALPATIVRRIPISPALPAQQHDAIARLKYGRGTKTLLQFSRRFWRIPGRPRAFGSPLPFGAFWEGNEEQRGRTGILALLAGGSASDLTQAIVAKEGPQGLVRNLE